MGTALATALQSAPLFARLTAEERAEAGVWTSICRGLLAVPSRERGAAVSRVLQERAGLKGLSRTRLYARLAAFRERGVEGLLPKRAAARAKSGRGTRLPAEFVAYWQALCGLHQRRKAEAVYRELMRRLASGAVIPGYGADWRGIWAAENPGCEPPPRCPWGAGLGHPIGWSYRNLADLAPERDVWLGAAQGAAAARALLPSVPHTRVGLPFGSVFFVDDVWHDFKVFTGQKEPQRPVELGMMEALTGRYATWGLCAVVRGADGARRMLRGSYMRFLLCDLLCRVGVSPDGATIFAEHGTANVGGNLLEAINAEIERLGGPKGFLKVALGGTYGAPVAAGLFQERPRGNPRWKAMLESSWNLLHNETAMLPGQVGRNRDAAPADEHGREKESSALWPLAQAIAKESPQLAGRLLTGFLSFEEAAEYLAKAKGFIETRTDHALEGWRSCGFTRHVATLPGGSELDLDEAARRHPEQIASIRALVAATGEQVREVPLSPLAAWHKCERERPLVRWPLSLAAVILGGDPDCCADCAVGDRGEIAVRAPDGSGRRSVFNAIVTDERGAKLALPRGARVRAILNPFDPSRCLVLDEAGRYLGMTGRPYEAGRYGDAEADKRNLGLWQEARAEQERRLAPVLDAQKKRRRAEIARSASALLEAGAAAAGPDRLGSDAPADLEEITAPDPDPSCGPDEPQPPSFASLPDWDPAAADCDETADFLASISVR